MSTSAPRTASERAYAEAKPGKDRTIAFAVALALLFLAGPMLAGCAANGVSLAPAATLGPQGGEAAPLRRQLWLVPSAEPGLAMRAHLYRPPGPGPFRLAIVAHGSEQDARLRAAMAMPRFDALTAGGR